MKTPVALTAGLLAALVLGGCVTPDPASQAPVSAPATDVGPGPAQADGTSAGVIFSSVCADTAPSFRQAPAILAKMPFRQHPTTGTYYHQNLDLSVKLMPKRCSMVFSSRENPMQLGLGLAAFAAVDSGSNQMGIDPDTGASATKGKGGTAFEFVPLGRANGRNMYRAVLIAP
ncbi:MAG: hypothetical protein WBO29_18175 [Albidovulum sp.]